MDNDILEILKRLESKLDDNTQELKKVSTKVDTIEKKVDTIENKVETIEKKVEKIENKVDKIEKKIDSIYDQTADLTEFRTETKEGIETIKKDIGKLTNVTKTNCFEIADLKAVK